MEMTQRAQEAKAHGLVIINDEDALFVPGSTAGYSADIPVVVIRSSDGDALLQAGDSSLLTEVQAPSKQNGLKPLPDDGGKHPSMSSQSRGTYSTHQWQSWDSNPSRCKNQTSDPLGAQHQRSSGLEFTSTSSAVNSTFTSGSISPPLILRACLVLSS